jgi:hypothetical protein
MASARLSFGRASARFKQGGDEGDRTLNPRLAKPVLSQLSYVPPLVGAPRFELGTSALSGLRSNQLSYAPANQSSILYVNNAF